MLWLIFAGFSSLAARRMVPTRQSNRDMATKRSEPLGALEHERFTLNPESGLPLYLQIAHEFVYRIESGLLQTGDKLPGIRKLAKELKISFLTVDKAYKWLRTRGLVTSKPGVGVRVAVALNSSGEQMRQRMQINKFAEKMITQGLAQHFDPMMLAQAVLHTAMAVQRRLPQKRIVFVECLPEYVDDYIAELRRELADFKLEIQGLLTTSLSKLVNSQEKSALDTDFLMTTLYHYDFVRRVVSPLRLRVVALSHTLDKEAIQRIVSLPAKCHLGALLGPTDPPASIVQTLEFYRDLPAGSMPFAVISDSQAVRKLLAKADVLLYTAACRPYIRNLQRKNKSATTILMRFVPDQEAINKIRMLLGSNGVPNRSRMHSR